MASQDDFPGPGHHPALCYSMPFVGEIALVLWNSVFLPACSTTHRFCMCIAKLYLPTFTPDITYCSIRQDDGPGPENHPDWRPHHPAELG